MSDLPDTRIAVMIAEKAAAELADVLPEGLLPASGDAPADVLVIKGEAGPEDLEAGRALGGADGEALRKALDALDWDAPFFAICTGQGDLRISARALAGVVEAVDPDLVLALDGVAAERLAEATGAGELPFGEVRRVAGRMIGAVDGFYASLSDEKRKRRVWNQLKAFKREV